MATTLSRSRNAVPAGASQPGRRLGAVTAFERSSLFVDLTPPELEALAEASSLCSVERHQVLLFEGQEVDLMYVVHSGSFKRVRQSREGKELILELLGPGRAFGAFGQAMESSGHIQALEASTCVAIPVARVRAALRGNVDFSLRLLAFLEARYGEAESSATRLAFESVPRRLAALLLETSREPRGELAFPLNQSEIASLIGSSRETVCSVLNRFRRERLIHIDRGRIRVLDRDRLRTE